MDVSVDALLQRLNRVEREIYWCKFIGCSVVVIVGLSLLLGASSSKVPEEIRAKRFLVMDPAGNAVGEFSATEGIPALKLSDPRGGARVVLSHGYDTGSGLAILDGKQRRADLSRRLDDSIALDLFDKEGKLRTVIALTGDGRPELVFHETGGKVIRKIP
jgi:hypothetical protein